MANRLVPAGMGFFDTSGNPLTGGKLEFFESGTSTNLDTFSDDALSVANANPVILDSAGRPAASGTEIDVFGKDQDYKMVLSDTDDVQIATFDPVRGFGSAADNLLDDTLRSALASGGSANAYTLTTSQTFSAYADGQVFVFEANHSNTDAATLNITPAGGSALGAKSLVLPPSVALVGGEIQSGAKIAAQYDGTNFQILTPRVPLSVLSTEQATTSGTAINFTSIPSWVSRITVMLNAVSTSGTSTLEVRIGTSGGIQTTGYSSLTAFISTAASADAAAVTDGFGVAAPAAADAYDGAMILTLENSSTGVWMVTGTFRDSNATAWFATGRKVLSGTLDRVQLTTSGGTDTFDSGAMNILYE